MFHLEILNNLETGQAPGITGTASYPGGAGSLFQSVLQ